MKTVNVLIGAALLCLVPMTNHAASKLSPTHGYYTAHVGAQCTTLEHGLAAIYLRDLTLAGAIMKVDDDAALKQMLDTKRVVATRPGVKVQIIERIEDGARTVLEVRPAGQSGTLWMLTYDVECPVPAKTVKTSTR
jgi:hypothetical protein